MTYDQLNTKFDDLKLNRNFDEMIILIESNKDVLIDNGWDIDGIKSRIIKVQKAYVNASKLADKL